MFDLLLGDSYRCGCRKVIFEGRYAVDAERCANADELGIPVALLLWNIGFINGLGTSQSR